MCGGSLHPSPVPSIIQPIHTMTYFYVIPLSLLIAILFLVLLRGVHHLCLLEAFNRSGSDLLMDGEKIGFSNMIIAVLRGNVGIRLYQELDPNISMTWKEYQWANTSHPPLTDDWEAVTDAALSSTKQILHSRGPDEETPLHSFIQSVVLSTFLRIFFSLPTTPANTEEVRWIAGKTCQESTMSPELSRLVKSSRNPSGVFAPLSTTRRLILAAICNLESGNGKIPFLRQAGTLLRHPISPEPVVTRLVEKVRNSHPPVQLVRGDLPWGPGFLIPVELLPPTACILGPDGGCTSWLHKAALPGQPECSGRKWLVHTTTIILSAIETEIRRGYLTIDGSESGWENWEDWVLRRLRV